MRLFALAQLCVEKGFRVSFASCQCPHNLQEKLHQAGVTFVLLPTNFCELDITSLQATALIVDDYNITNEQWQYFTASGALLVNIDDNINQLPLLSHIIVNPSAAANAEEYKKRAPNAILCLGSQYTLLREEFRRQVYVPLEERKHILVTLGAADVKNMTCALAVQLLKCVDTSTPITLLLGGLQSQNLQVLQKLRKHHSNIEIVEKSTNVAQLMMRSGLAISAAGGTLGELASMGTPSIGLVSVDNQEAALLVPPNQRWYTPFDVRNYNSEQEDLGAALLTNISEYAAELWLDLCKRKHISGHARQIIDGRGCERVVEHIVNAL